MKKIIICFVIITFATIGCNRTTKDPVLEKSPEVFDLCEMISESLIEFFGVDSIDSLMSKKFASVQKTENINIHMVAEKKYSDDITDAHRVAYIGDPESDFWPVLFINRSPDKAKQEKIVVSGGLEKIPMFYIEYNLENEYFEYYPSPNKEQTPLEYCLDDCIEEKLQNIADSNWIRQTRFLLNAPVEFAWIVVDCSWDCLIE
jgi:hypothetical protein